MGIELALPLDKGVATCALPPGENISKDSSEEKKDESNGWGLFSGTRKWDRDHSRAGNSK